MKLLITIDCGNDAFKPHWQDEAARILRSLAKKIEASVDNGVTPTVLQLDDSNGNNVGCMEVEL